MKILVLLILILSSPHLHATDCRTDLAFGGIMDALDRLVLNNRLVTEDKALLGTIITNVKKMKAAQKNGKFLSRISDDSRTELIAQWTFAVQNVNELLRNPSWNSEDKRYFEEILKAAVAFLAKHFAMLASNERGHEKIDYPRFRALLQLLVQAKGSQATWALFQFKRMIGYRFSMWEFIYCK